MPSYRLSRNDREEMSAINMVRQDRLDIDPNVWTPQHVALLKTVSQRARGGAHFRQRGDQEGALPGGRRRSRLAHEDPADLRPRLPFPHPPRLPGRRGGCGDQDAAAAGDGCGAELAQWFTPQMLHPKPGPPRKPMTLAALPAECRRVLTAQ